MNNIYEVRIGNKTYTIGAYSFDNCIGHIYDFAFTFKICEGTSNRIVNKPHIRLAPKAPK